MCHLGNMYEPGSKDSWSSKGGSGDACGSCEWFHRAYKLEDTSEFLVSSPVQHLIVISFLRHSRCLHWHFWLSLSTLFFPYIDHANAARRRTQRIIVLYLQSMRFQLSPLSNKCHMRIYRMAQEGWNGLHSGKRTFRWTLCQNRGEGWKTATLLQSRRTDYSAWQEHARSLLCNEIRRRLDQESDLLSFSSKYMKLLRVFLCKTELEEKRGKADV